MWVKFPFDVNKRILADDMDANALNGFVIDMGASGELRWRLRNTSTSVSAVTSTNTYGDNEWHHLVAIKGSSTNYLYIDGGAEVKYVATTNGINHSTGVRFGNSRTIFYNGDIDQVRIFNKALSASEVTTLYNEVACEKTCTTA